MQSLKSANDEAPAICIQQARRRSNPIRCDLAVRSARNLSAGEEKISRTHTHTYRHIHTHTRARACYKVYITYIEHLVAISFPFLLYTVNLPSPFHAWKRSKGNISLWYRSVCEHGRGRSRLARDDSLPSCAQRERTDRRIISCGRGIYHSVNFQLFIYKK